MNSQMQPDEKLSSSTDTRVENLPSGCNSKSLGRVAEEVEPLEACTYFVGTINSTNQEPAKITHRYTSVGPTMPNGSSGVRLADLELPPVLVALASALSIPCPDYPDDFPAGGDVTDGRAFRACNLKCRRNDRARRDLRYGVQQAFNESCGTTAGDRGRGQVDDSSGAVPVDEMAASRFRDTDPRTESNHGIYTGSDLTTR